MSDENSWFHDEDGLGRRIQMQWMRIPPTHLLRLPPKNTDDYDDDMKLFHHPTTLPISMTDLLGEPNLLSIWHKNDDDDDDDESSGDESSYCSSSSSSSSKCNLDLSSSLSNKEGVISKTTARIRKDEWMEWYQTIWQKIHQIYTNLPKTNEDEFSLYPFKNLELKTTIFKNANNNTNTTNTLLTPIEITCSLNDYLVTMSTQQKNQTTTTTITALLFIYAIQILQPDQNLISSYILIILQIPPLSFSVNERKRITWLLSKVANQILIEKQFSKEELNRKLQPLLCSSENSNEDDIDPHYYWKRESYMAIVRAFMKNEKQALQGM